MFSGVPYGAGWTEFNAGNPPEDRRFIMSSGPVSFASGGELTLDFAYVYTRDSLNANGLATSVARNIADVQRIKYWFDNDNFPSCEVYSVGVEEQTSYTINLFPNPANDFISVNQNLSLTQNLYYEITDVSGRVIIKNKFKNSRLDVSKLTSGFYIFRLFNGTNSAAAKFVKQ
jgi:hypothetical protein